MTFASMIYNSRHPDNPLSPEENEAPLVKHRAVQEQTGPQLLSVAQLTDLRHGRSHTQGSPSVQLTDAPYIEAKEWLVGFYMLDCPAQATAESYAQQLCTPDHRIELRPVGWHHVP